MHSPQNVESDILLLTLCHICVWNLWEIPYSKNHVQIKNTLFTDKYVGAKMSSTKRKEVVKQHAQEIF
jgi:hypothetical protein